MIKDLSEQDYQVLRKMRNEAGTYLSEGEFKRTFEAILEMKHEVKKRLLHSSIFNNLLEEVIVIGAEMSQNPLILLSFNQYLQAHNLRLDNV